MFLVSRFTDPGNEEAGTGMGKWTWGLSGVGVYALETSGQGKCILRLSVVLHMWFVGLDNLLDCSSQDIVMLENYQVLRSRSDD